MFQNSYPLVNILNIQSYGKSPSLVDKSTTNGQCSIVMLNYQRVYCKSLFWAGYKHVTATSSLEMMVASKGNYPEHDQTFLVGEVVKNSYPLIIMIYPLVL
jgi:hypothetical protein